MIRPLVFADLDDTLFQTRRKLDPAQQDLTVAAVAGDGDPTKTSFATPCQMAMLSWLQASAEVIPVTARSGDAYARVKLGFDGWAVISNGAVILEPGGQPHQPWADRMTALLRPRLADLQALLEAGRAEADRRGMDVRSWLVEEEGLATYLVFKMNLGADDALKDLDFGAAGVDLTGWVRHRNGNNLALIPPGSGKRGAVEYLLARLDETAARPVIGMGDSLSDLAFMDLADMALIPRASQIRTAIPFGG